MQRISYSSCQNAFENFACAYCISIYFPQIPSFHKKMSQLREEQLLEDARKELAIVGMKFPVNHLACKIVKSKEDHVPKENKKGGRAKKKNFSKHMPESVVEVMQLKTPENSDSDNDQD